MIIPKVNTKFLYLYESISGKYVTYIGEMVDEVNFADIHCLDVNIFSVEQGKTTYNFIGSFIENRQEDLYKFISEVDSLEHAKELYPEYFI